MSEKNIVLITHHADGKNQNVTASEAHPAKVVVKPGSQYLLKNETNDFAPENVTLKRVGDDLVVIQEGDSQPSLIFEDYYAKHDGHPPVLLGMAEDGMVYPYIPVSGESYETGYLIADGQLSPVALGGDSLGPGAPYLVAQEDSNNLYPLFALLAGAGAIGAGAAIVHHNNKDDDSSSPAVTPPQSQGIGQITDNTGPVKGALTDGAITDESMPQISGQGTAGNVITIYDNGTAIGSTTIDANGKWSWTPVTPMADGSHALDTTETDPAGNVSDASDAITIVVDTTPPAQSTVPTITDGAGNVIDGGGATNEAQPTIAGEGEAGNTVVIYDNDQPIGSVVVDADGSWSFTPDAPMADGSHSIHTVETDPAGNSSTPSEAEVITIDTIVPSAVVPTITDGAGNVIDNGGATNEAQPTISGEGEAGNTVVIYDNDQPIGSVVVDADGSWSFTPDAPMADGSHSINTVETDPAGNSSAPTAAEVITIDTVVPSAVTPTITDGAGNVIDNGSATNEAQPTISGEGEAGNTVVIYDNDQPIGSVVVDADGSWSFTPDAPMADGSHSINTVETDPAGNSSAPTAAEVITIDTVVPSAVTPTITDGAGNVIDNGGATNEAQPTISGEGEAGNTVVIYDNDQPIGSVVVDADGSWSFTPDAPMADGSHSINTVETDPAGNSSAPTAASDITIDTVAAGDTVTVYSTLNGTQSVLGSATVGADGTWSLAVDAEHALAAGTHGLTAVESDPAGNSTSPTPAYTVTVVTGSPAAPSINTVIDDVGVTETLQKGAVTNDSTPTLNGTAGNGVTVRVYDNGTLIGSTTSDASGSWSFTPAKAVADGEHAFTADVVNGVGQVSAQSGAWALTVDTAAPAAVGDLVITDDVGAVTGALADGDTTDDSTPALSGTAEAGATVNILDNGQVIATVTAAEDGAWSWTPAASLDDGSHAFSVTVTDAAGNSSEATAETHIIIDTLAPEVILAIQGYQDDVGTITGLITDNNGVTDDTSPVLTGTWTGTLSETDVIRIYQDDMLIGEAKIDLVNQSWTYDITGLENNVTYSWTATAVDAVGNETAISPAFTLTIDLDPPTQTVEISTYSDVVGADVGEFTSGTSTDDRNPTLKGSVSGDALDEGDVIRIYDAVTNELLGNATLNGDNTWSFHLPSLADNTTYNFKAVVADAAGNEGTFSNEFVLTVDLSVVVNTQETTDTTPIVSGYTGFEIGDGEYVDVEINGVTYSSRTGAVVVDPLNNTWYVQLPDSAALAVGTYDVKATLHASDGSLITADDTSGELVISPEATVTVGAGASNADQKATAVTIGEDGVWRIHTNQAMLDSTGTSSSSLGDFSVTSLTSNSGTGYSGNNYVQNATFIDYNRDGYMDLFAVDSTYNDGQQMFYYNGSVYTAYQVGALTNAPQTGEFAGNANTSGSANTWSWYGGIIAIDKDGDGYVDMVVGDQTPNDSAIRGGYGSQIVLNHDGTLYGMDKDGNFATDYATDASHRPIGLDQSQPDMELSGVDLNNDGIVDFVMHSQNIVADGSRIDAEGATNSTAAISTNQARLVVVNGTDNGSWSVTQVVDNVFQRGTDSDPNIGNGVAMTWADFNGDGYMDLFLGRGSASNTAASAANNSAGEYASRIYFNDGTGKLIFDDPNNDGIGNPTASGMYTFDDTLAGGASIAVDWDHDGKMDVIELPGMASTSGGITAAATTGPINLYINTTTDGVVSFTTTNLLTQIGATTIGSSANQVTGAVSIDLNWDGSRDLLAFTSNGTTTYIENKNQVEYGTSIHLRILDAEGINSLYGNTVQLIDESTGNVVSTQIINAQSGNQTNDSTAIVDFYGLNANTTYSAVILRHVNGVSADVGGVAAVGSNVIENVNRTWGGLIAEEANHAYILTTESETNVANASTNGGTNNSGIVGTGYNDTFFATLGNDIYNGGGGTETISNVKTWSNTGGHDVVDYILAGDTALTIDLSNTAMQQTGFGAAQFINIEGLAGASGNDTFTGNSENNSFEGRGGDDIFNLAAGGQDTLIYKALMATNDGGNGHDTVNGFFIGTVEATPNADIIDIKDLLVGYTADADGPAHYINGKATIDVGDNITDYLSVTHSGNDTIINIDRDGQGTAYAKTAIITLTDTNVEIEMLLANHQIIVS